VPRSYIRRPRKKNNTTKKLAETCGRQDLRFDTSASTITLQREPNLERHLPVTDFTVLDISTGLGHLKPAHVANGLFSVCQGVFYRLFKSVGRGTNHLDLFVNMIRHGQLFPDDTAEYNKKRALAKVGAYAERTLRLAAGRHVAKFALQTHRNFGSLASWENWLTISVLLLAAGSCLHAQDQRAQAG
jgi:hypothetical protein